MNSPAGDAGAFPPMRRPGVSARRRSAAVQWQRPGATALLLAALMVFQSGAMSDSHYDSDPAALRDALVEAAAGDPALLDVLCRRYRSTIVRHFESWRQVPPSLHSDEDQVTRYGAALFAIASQVAHHGDRTLMGLLEGRAGSARIMTWGRTYNDAERLVDQDRCAEAIAILEPIVDATPAWAGTAIEPLAPRVHGILGLCHSRLGDQENALKWTYSAYELCVTRKDPDGIIAYGGNMAEIFRKLGDHGRFSDWLKATIGVMESAGRVDEARSLRERYASGP